MCGQSSLACRVPHFLQCSSLRDVTGRELCLHICKVSGIISNGIAIQNWENRCKSNDTRAGNRSLAYDGAISLPSVESAQSTPGDTRLSQQHCL